MLTDAIWGELTCFHDDNEFDRNPFIVTLPFVYDSQLPPLVTTGKREAIANYSKVIQFFVSICALRQKCSVHSAEIRKTSKSLLQARANFHRPRYALLKQKSSKRWWAMRRRRQRQQRGGCGWLDGGHQSWKLLWFRKRQRSGSHRRDGRRRWQRDHVCATMTTTTFGQPWESNFTLVMISIR